jgi:hypothetical protein
MTTKEVKGDKKDLKKLGRLNCHSFLFASSEVEANRYLRTESQRRSLVRIKAFTTPTHLGTNLDPGSKGDLANG